MNHSEEYFAGWGGLRDAEGNLGQIGPLVDLSVERAARGEPVEIEPLTEILLIPGVLCSAAPRVVRDFLGAIPQAIARTKRDLLAVIFDLSETVFAPHQESIKFHSDGAVSPYSSYDRLRSSVIHAIQTGERLYRSECAARPRKTITDRELFAAVLLSKCEVTDVALLDIYDAAIATDANVRKQALLFNAAANVANRCGVRTSYLSRYIHPGQDQQQFSVARLLAASYLAESLSDADLRDAFGDPSTRRHISLPDTLAPLDANTRFRVFKAIFLSGALSPGEPLVDALELLRSVFPHPAAHKGLRFFSDAEGQHLDFLFGAPPAKLREEFGAAEREALSILANCDAVWVRRSNLWRHFGLPDSQEGIRQLIG